MEKDTCFLQPSTASRNVNSTVTTWPPHQSRYPSEPELFLFLSAAAQIRRYPEKYKHHIRRCHNMSPRKTLTGTFWWTVTWSPNIDLKIWKQVQQNPSKCPCTQFFSCTRQCQKFHDSQFYHRGAAKKLKLSQLMIPYLVHSTPKCITKYGL